MSPSIRSLLLLAAFAVAICAHSGHGHHHEHTVAKRLPGSWDQPESHPVHALFRRAPDTTKYPEVGSPEWKKKYPVYPYASPDLSAVPQAWFDALKAAISAGKIPDIPPSTAQPNANPVYPQGLDPAGQTVCSTTYQCQHEGDLWNAPDGVFAISFDDGPIPPSGPLLDLVEKEKLQVTHFMIGSRILENPQMFLRAFNLGGDIAVHTYTHPYMTTMTNEQVIAEIGFTMQIIHDSSGGRLPKYWRPPYGDADNRVRAIAKEIFGLTTVIWNRDSADWSIGQAATSPTTEKVEGDIQGWIKGSKTNGLLPLEHELSDITVGVFLNIYPSLKESDWKIVSVARLDGGNPYQNAASNTDTVVLQAVTAPASPNTTSSSPTSSSGMSSKPTAPASSGNVKSGNSTSSTPSVSGTAQQAGSAVALHSLQSLLLACFLAAAVALS